MTIFFTAGGCAWRLLVFVLCVVALAPAHALDPAIELGGYRHDRWSDADGAPGMIETLAQTDDGWLWVASQRSGLYRFDGVRFLPYETRDGSRLQYTSISVLRPAGGNALWIGHGRGGVSVLRGDRLTHVLAPQATASVYALAVGPDGSVWAASRRGLFRIRDDKAAPVGAGQGYASTTSQYVLADGQGRVWAADSQNLYVLEPGAAAFRRVRETGSDPMLIEAQDGSVWFVLGKRFTRLTAAAVRKVPAPPGRSSTFQSVFDRDGNLWTGNCPVGLCVVRPAAWRHEQAFDALPGSERLDQGWQLTSLTVLASLTDREGNLWVGTAAGLDRFRDQPVHMVEALFEKGKMQALPHPDGSIVVSGTQRMNGSFGLWRIGAGNPVPVPMPNPLGFKAIARAADGSLVLAGGGGIERHTAAGVQRIPLPPIPLAPGKSPDFRLLDAGNDTLWARVVGHGYWRYRAGQWNQVYAEGKGPSTLAVDAAGRVYLAFRPGRLQILEGGTTRDVDTSGADVGDIVCIDAGTDVIVAGTRANGILRNGRIETLRFAPPGGPGPFSGIAVGPDGTAG